MVREQIDFTLCDAWYTVVREKAMICSSVETWAWRSNVTLSGCNILMRRARANIDKLIYLIEDATRRWVTVSFDMLSCRA